MLDDQQRQVDSENTPTNVVVTTQSAPHIVERVETVPQTTQVDVYPAADNSTNELAVDRSGRSLRARGESLGQRRRYDVRKTIDYVWYALGVLEVVLAGRFFFELTAANSAAGFVKFVLSISQPFSWPFNGVFPIPRDGNNAFDTNVLIAMAVYALITWGITRFLAMTIEPPSVR